jgi:hypothetical protein
MSSYEVGSGASKKRTHVHFFPAPSSSKPSSVTVAGSTDAASINDDEDAIPSKRPPKSPGRLYPKPGAFSELDVQTGFREPPPPPELPPPDDADGDGEDVHHVPQHQGEKQAKMSDPHEPSQLKSIVLEIDIGDGTSAKVLVTPMCNPAELAFDFLSEHDLNPDYFEPLAEYISQTRMQLLEMQEETTGGDDTEANRDDAKYPDQSGFSDRGGVAHDFEEPPYSENVDQMSTVRSPEHRRGVVKSPGSASEGHITPYVPLSATGSPREHRSSERDSLAAPSSASSQSTLFKSFAASPESFISDLSDQPNLDGGGRSLHITTPQSVVSQEAPRSSLKHRPLASPPTPPEMTINSTGEPHTPLTTNAGSADMSNQDIANVLRDLVSSGSIQSVRYFIITHGISVKT